MTGKNIQLINTKPPNIHKNQEKKSNAKATNLPRHQLNQEMKRVFVNKPRFSFFC